MANHGVPAIIPANAASKDVDISEPTSPFARDKSDTAAHTEQHMKHEDLGPLPLKQSPFFTRAPFIIGQELCERMAYYGIATNIISYLTGKLNYNNGTAASLVNAWSGTCYLTPLLGAFIADAYWGRYLVILVFSLSFYLPGLIGLTLSAGIPALRPEAGQSPSGGQAAFFWIFMYLVALGTGGIKPCVSSFGADQFDMTDPRQAALIPRFFNWFYAAINVGAVIASLFLVNIQQSVSWTLGFAIPAGAFAVATCVFLIGTKLYRRVPPGGSPFTRVFRVLIGAFKHRKRPAPESEEDLYEVDGDDSIITGQPKMERTPKLKKLDKAAVPAKTGSGRFILDGDKWLTTLTEVEETKCLLKLLPIALTLIMYQCVYAQMTTLFIIQGQGMDTNLGSLHLAPATLSVLDCLSVIIFVAIYDLVIQPFFIKIGKPIGLLTRIGIGYCVAILSMITAAIVEVFRLRAVANAGLTDVNPSSPGAPTMPMTFWVQVPQYALVGISEVFAMIGSMEFFYAQAPDAMRSTCSAIQLLTVGIGSYLASALVAIVGPFGWIANNVNQGHLDYFFYLLAVLMFLDLLLFIWLASMYTYKQTIHTTVDPQAMALAPDLRTGMAFSPSIQMQLSKDIAEGMLTVEMTRSGTLTNAYSDFLGKKRSGDVMWTSLSKRSTAKGSGNV